jgi:hypothetical protein
MLLPAFEPFASSSPALPRPMKRKYDGSPCHDRQTRDYITPVPTSCTDVLPSSPPPRPTTRTALDRSTSNASERIPLGAVRSVEVPIDGEEILMGRSSNSSHFQLSANRLISRIHVRVAYVLPDDSHINGQVIVRCVGWNGAKVHCRGKVFELGKEDTFTSDRPHADMLVDVQDARVLVRWPPIQARQGSPTRWSEDDTPRRPVTPSRFASSPPPLQLHSPVSPSPRDRPTFTMSSTFLGLPPSSSPVRVYEDRHEENVDDTIVPDVSSPLQHVETQPASPTLLAAQKTPPISDVEDFSDQDEENEPIVHGFGASGANLLARMTATTRDSPVRPRIILKPSNASQPRSPAAKPVPSRSPVRNHVINQLAYSRLQSIPLSSIMNNLPSALKGSDENESAAENRTDLSDAELKSLLDDIACVGEIVRKGKDAAGKPLEDEFYYISELDTDETRRTIVETSLGKRSLRATRKEHKVRFRDHLRYGASANK